MDGRNSKEQRVTYSCHATKPSHGRAWTFGAGSERSSAAGTSTDGVRSKMPQRRQALGLHGMQTSPSVSNKGSGLRAWAERELDRMTS